VNNTAEKIKDYSIDLAMELRTISRLELELDAPELFDEICARCVNNRLLSDIGSKAKKFTAQELLNSYFECNFDERSSIRLLTIFLLWETSKCSVRSVKSAKCLNAAFWLYEKCGSSLSVSQKKSLLELIEYCAENYISLPNTRLRSTLHDSISQNLVCDRDLSVTFLFVDGPVARSYLYCLKSLGIEPKHLIEVVFSNDIHSQKEIGEFLPTGLRLHMCKYLNQERITHWPKKLLNLYGDALDDLYERFKKENSILNFSSHTNKNLYYGAPQGTKLASTRVLVKDINDIGLIDILNKSGNDVILFSGGGIISKESLQKIKNPILHIHPGYLPNVRGADGLIWSKLLYGKAAASGILLKPGIDTGEIVFQKQLENFDLDGILNKISKSHRYNFLYSFVDPLVRVDILSNILSLPNFGLPNLVEQNDLAGAETFNFVATKLRDKLLLNFTN